jgi:hypothetical protein
MRPEILCVHQIGKVGSTTVSATLERMLPDRRIYQTHALSDTGVLFAMERWLANPAAPRLNVPYHLLRSIELARHISRGVESADWYVLSLVREPLGRDVSAFFQNLHNHWIHRLPAASQDVCRRVLKSTASPAATSDEIQVLVRELAKIFTAEYPRGLFDNWFKREMRNVFGIDVFARPFPAQRGYDIFQNGSVRLLLVRLEDLRETFAPAVSEWLAGSSMSRDFGDSVSLEHANDGSAKGYSDLYRSFLQEFHAHPEMVENAYGSMVARHFYTDEERAGFQARWKVVDGSDDAVSNPVRPLESASR